MDDEELREKVYTFNIRNYAKENIIDLLIKGRGKDYRNNTDIIDIEVIRPTSNIYTIYVCLNGVEDITDGWVLWSEKEVIYDNYHFFYKIYKNYL